MNNKHHNIITILNSNRKKIGLFFFCIIISIFLWFILLLSDTYTYKYSPNITLRNNASADRVTIDDLDNINLKITGLGWQILKLKLNPFSKKLSLNTNKLSVSTLYTEQYIDQLQRQLPPGVTIESIDPITIDIKHLGRIEKKVPIDIKLDISFKKQFYFSGNHSLNVDSVTIYGKKNLVDAINKIEIPELKFYNLEDSVKTSINIARIFANKGVDFEPQRVYLTIPVELFTEGVVNAPIKVINDSEDMSLSLYPNKVKVKFLCPISKYPFINEEMFGVHVNLDDWKKDSLSMLNVNLAYYPEYVRIINIDQNAVDFILKKNNIK